jgi:hypothetical protein
MEGLLSTNGLLTNMYSMEKPPAVRIGLIQLLLPDSIDRILKHGKSDTEKSEFMFRVFF